MKTVATLVVVIGLALAVVTISIAGGDRGTLVPPPDAVAESFARALMQGRYALAERYLSNARRVATGREGLRAWFESSRRRLGRLEAVEGSVEPSSDDGASARASVEAQFGTAVLQLRLIRERGLWVIDELPSEVLLGVAVR